jgi:DNA-binding CsgD family transcriptional regulator
VLHTTGVQSEAQLPFAGLHRLVLPVLDHTDRLPGPQQTALLGAFGMTEAAAPDRFLIALAVLELLSDAAERSPLLVVADDAQWLDQSTADALGFVARRVDHEPIGVLVANREGEESFFDEAGLPELQLGGLQDTAAESLLDAQAPDLASTVREQLLDEAKGNPLALVELPVAWDQVRDGTLLMAQVPLTTRLEQAFATRIVELPTITRTVLLVAALNDGESLSETLEAASKLAGRELTVEHVAPAVSAQLVGADETGLRFRHPLVRTAIHQAASMSQRHAAHAALAMALAGQPDRSVWHRAASIIGPDEEVASELEAAATRARRRKGIVVAVAALERAAQLTEAPAPRGGRLLHAAVLAFELGRHDVVVRLLDDAEPLELDSADRTRLLWLREMLEEHLWSRATRVEDSVALAEQIRRDGGSDRALDFLMTAALKCWRFNPRQETRDLVVTAAEGLPIAEDDPKLLAILAFADPVRCGGMILQRISGLPNDVRAEPEAMRLLGTALTAVGAFDRSRQFLAASTDDLRSQGRLGLLARSLVSQAWTAVFLGTFTDADPAAEEAERLARETEQPRWAAGAQLACATLAGLRGEADVAESLAAQAERVLLPTGSSSMLALVQIARGVTALGAGHFEDAYEHLRRVFDPADIAFHPVERSWVLLDLVDAAVHSGHHDEARALVGELEPLVAQTRSPVLQAELSCAQPLLADHAVAEARFERALGADLAAWPFSRARLLLAYGAWLRRQRRVGESRVPLRTAREAFDALGVPPWAERARHELRGAGVTSHPRERHAMHKLTPKELQIARMAASGLSNREIGQQLYLSHRTVGAHLYRAFPKLGITSRGQLRDAIDTALP